MAPPVTWKIDVGRILHNIIIFGKPEGGLSPSGEFLRSLFEDISMIMKKGSLIAFTVFVILSASASDLSSQTSKGDEAITLTAVTLQGRASHVFVHRNLCYVSRGGELLILDASDPFHLKLMGSIFSPGEITDIFASGSYVYLAKRGEGLVIVDASDPSDPKKIGSFALEGYVGGIYVVDKLAYIVSYDVNYRRGWLRIIDATDPAHLMELSSLSVDFPLHDICLSGNLAYVAGTTGFQVIDVSDPKDPVKVGAYTTGSSCVVYVRGALVYLTIAGQNKFQIINTDLTTPKKLGELTLSGGVPTYIRLSEDGKYAYVTVANSRLAVVDVSDPSSPKEVGYYHAKASDVYISGGFAYLAASNQGLQVVDISDPRRPKGISSYETGDEVHGVYVSGNYAYVAYGFGGLRILDVSDPSNPREIGSLRRISEGSFDVGGRAMDVWVSGNLACLLEQGGGLSIIDISTPTSPRRLAFYTVPGSFPYRGQIRVSGHYVYIVGFEDGLIIVNISDPEHPRYVSSIGGTDSKLVLGVCLSDDLAYIATMSGLEIIDVSEPSSPRKVGTYDPGWWPRCIFVAGDYAYLSRSVGRRGLTLYIIDVSDPSDPKEVGSLSIPEGGRPRGLFIQGNYAYLNVDRSPNFIQLLIIDISRPSHPINVGSYKVASPNFDTVNPNPLYVYDGYIYIPAYSAGLYIFGSHSL